MARQKPQPASPFKTPNEPRELRAASPEAGKTCAGCKHFLPFEDPAVADEVGLCRALPPSMATGPRCVKGPVCRYAVVLAATPACGTYFIPRG